MDSAQLDDEGGDLEAYRQQYFPTPQALHVSSLRLALQPVAQHSFLSVFGTSNGRRKRWNSGVIPTPGAICGLWSNVVSGSSTTSTDSWRRVVHVPFPESPRHTGASRCGPVCVQCREGSSRRHYVGSLWAKSAWATRAGSSQASAPWFQMSFQSADSTVG